MTSALATTTELYGNTTHIFDTYDYFIHPHWRQFPLIPDAWHYAIGIFMTVVGISGVLGNILVLYIFATTKSLRTPSNMFVVNLALSDLTFSAVNGFPLYSLSAFSGRWLFGKVACELYGLAGGIFGLMSINTMAAIAIDRYNVITKPIKASRSLSYRKAFLMLVIVWVWSLTWTLPPLFGWGAYIPEGFQTHCTFDYLTRTQMSRSFIMCLYICGFLVPLSIIMYSYYFIYRAVAIHEKEMSQMAKKLNAEIRQGQSQQKSDIKTAKIAMMIITTYLLSWTPYATIALVAQFGPAQYITPYLAEIPVIFAKASAMHNPVIYALSHPRFREVLNTRFPWLLCCCGYKEKEAESMPDVKSKVSRMDSVNSNIAGGAMSQASEMSNLSDSGYPEGAPEVAASNHAHPNNPKVSMRMKAMGGQQQLQQQQQQQQQHGGGEVEANSNLIRDILQAFVGVVNAQGQRQVPVYIPPQYMAQFAAPGVSVPPQGGIYTLPTGGAALPGFPPTPMVIADIANNPPPPPPPVAVASSSPATPKTSPGLGAQLAQGPGAGSPAEGAPNGTVTVQAEVNAHVNQAYQED